MMYRALMLLSFICASGCLQAGIYQWVDSQGVVHYSDTPQPTVKAKAYTLDYYKVSSADTQRRVQQVARLEATFQAHKASRLEHQEARAEKKREKAELKALCTRMEKELNDYKTAQVLYELDAKGEMVMFSDERRKQTTQQLAASIEKTC